MSVANILVPKTRKDIIDTISGIYNIDSEDSDVEFLMNLYMAFNILPAEHHKCSIAFLDYTETEGDLENFPSVGITLYTKHVEITKKVKSFETIYKEAKRMIDKNHMKHDFRNKSAAIEMYIYAGANIIAAEGRRGPGNFAILNENVIKKISENNTFRTIVDNSLKDNEIIVGRKGASDEPGIAMVTYENWYKLTTLGDKPERQYVKIKF